MLNIPARTDHSNVAFVPNILNVGDLLSNSNQVCTICCCPSVRLDGCPFVSRVNSKINRAIIPSMKKNLLYTTCISSYCVYKPQ